MFWLEVIIVLFGILALGASALVMTAVKLGIYKVFDFMFERVLWLQYMIYHTVFLVIVGVVFYFDNDFSLGSMTRNFLIVFG